MKLRTLTFIVLASVAALTGCEDKTSVEWYTAHHDDMLKKYEECLNTQTWQAPDCVNAHTASQRERGKPDVDASIREISERFNKKRLQL
ncbi:EexN family lipoprotein [Enterobacter hormaechei]|uniref:EexN family lipoprotein n=1 Tax=Enterobacter hormaechei TaxID=158836 RepID=UPI00297AF6E2|nr:EexN family lipoprotein [Enterobacter cloacae]HAS1149772.1 EexN family lipoprotein [Enterobacter cloacae]HAV2197053.1 EexN family lipoprotein [Enterobacter cloacae]HCM9645925.1 EexN family lipoprotein [Enterobacter hormaechei subsp. xiangfangensis]HDC4542842.1 EexN family lipoprotein [Enterobacter cloacae]